MDSGGPEGRFVIGNGYAIYRGPVADSVMHAHAAYQIAVAVHAEVAVMDDSGVCHRGAVLVVPPMTRHHLLPDEDLLTVFVEPQCDLADHLRALCGQGEPDVPARPSGALDPRLRTAMDAALAREVPIPELAALAGLSPQRLRALARHQLGMPLSRWRMWARLRRTVEALGDGHSLSDAAVAGGFADQAHLTRRMRELMGVTPGSVLPVLRHQLRDAP
ncbi:AraC family transcriptional regulator [Streptomyces sp. TP-A0874]|uniref:AraC family transcriptional regulator n=1 Tax=Streptomyces sp. TP-A0874 TaxID=549819 RepID=UPI000ACBE3C7|nr:AraC family transcriptional regulator [Streptomyces sp. TP-A0874]